MELRELSSNHNSVYDRLLEMPLFQGLNSQDITNIIYRIKVDFRKFSKGKVIVTEGSPCDNLYFILEGNIQRSFVSSRKKLCFKETLLSPCVLGVSNMYGMTLHFMETYIAISDVTCLVIPKRCVNNVLFDFDVFRINMLNMLSAMTQKSMKILRNEYNPSIQNQFIHFLKQNYSTSSGTKELLCKMEDLAEVIHTTRLKVSRMLNDFENRGLLQLYRKRILIPAFEQLIADGILKKNNIKP